MAATGGNRGADFFTAAGDVDTGFFIRDSWISGPSPFLPFAPQPGGGAQRVAGG